MRIFVFFVLVVSLAVTCVPPSGTTRVTPAGKSKSGLFSIRGMTDAILEMEGARGTERIQPLQRKYEKAYKADPKDPFHRFLWAYSLDDRNEAWAEMTKVTKLNDQFYWAYLGMGIILDGWKVYDQAENNFKRALELGPKIALGHGRFGRMYLKKGDAAAALPLLQRAVELDPSRIAYRLDMARALDARGRSADARRTYELVLKSKPDSFEAAAELADLIRRGGDRAAAAEAYARAASLDDKAFEVRFVRAGLLEELKLNEKALHGYEEACVLKPDDPACWLAMARLAGSLDRQDVTRAAYEQVARIDPENLEAQKYLGPVYLAAGEIERALPAFQLVLKKEESNLVALSGLASIYEQGEEFSRAIEFNVRVLAQVPEDSRAREATARLFERFHIVPEHFTGKNPDQVFARNREQIAKVYKLRLQQRPDMAGTLHLKVTVSNEGDVQDVTMAKNTVSDQLIDLCAIWNLRRSKFPAGFGATYDFELTLKPGEK